MRKRLHPAPPRPLRSCTPKQLDSRTHLPGAPRCPSRRCSAFPGPEPQGSAAPLSVTSPDSLTPPKSASASGRRSRAFPFPRRAGPRQRLPCPRLSGDGVLTPPRPPVRSLVPSCPSTLLAAIPPTASTLPGSFSPSWAPSPRAASVPPRGGPSSTPITPAPRSGLPSLRLSSAPPPPIPIPWAPPRCSHFPPPSEGPQAAANRLPARRPPRPRRAPGPAARKSERGGVRAPTPSASSPRSGCPRCRGAGGGRAGGRGACSSRAPTWTEGAARSRPVTKASSHANRDPTGHGSLSRRRRSLLDSTQRRQHRPPPTGALNPTSSALRASTGSAQQFSTREVGERSARRLQTPSGERDVPPRKEKRARRHVLWAMESSAGVSLCACAGGGASGQALRGEVAQHPGCRSLTGLKPPSRRSSAPPFSPSLLGRTSSSYLPGCPAAPVAGEPWRLVKGWREDVAWVLVAELSWRRGAGDRHEATKKRGARERP